MAKVKRLSTLNSKSQHQKTVLWTTDKLTCQRYAYCSIAPKAPYVDISTQNVLVYNNSTKRRIVYLIAKDKLWNMG